MNKQEKKKFIKDYCKHLQASMLNQVSKMPENWDGLEIRELFADKTRDLTFSGMSAKRMNEYENTCIVENIG